MICNGTEHGQSQFIHNHCSHFVEHVITGQSVDIIARQELIRSAAVTVGAAATTLLGA
jgi:hypothetical protein